MASQPQKTPNYGGNFGNRFFHFVLKNFGLYPSYFFLNFAVPYYILFRPSVRKSSSFYLKRRFPGERGVKRFFRTVKYITKFSEVLIDQAAIGILGKEIFKIDFPNSANLYKMANKENGIVLLTSHIGNWQTAMATMKSFNKPINFLLQMDEHMHGKHFFDLSGEKDQIKFIDPTGFMGGLVEATNVLYEGECVSIMGDRAMGWKTGNCNFLGEKADFPLTAHHLAAITGAELIMFVTVRTGKLAFKIHSINLTEKIKSMGKLTKKEMINKYLESYVQVLENYIERYPYMWFNFFDFWKKQ